MKILATLVISLFSTGALLAADAKAELLAAVHKLEGQSYRWITYNTSAHAPENRLDGKADGAGWVEIEANNGAAGWPMFWKAGKGVIKISDAWLPLDAALKRAREGFKVFDDGRIAYTKTARAVWVLGNMLTFRPPAEDLGKFLEDAKSVEQNDGVYTLNLSDEAIKRLARLNPEPEEGRTPPSTNVPLELKGTVKVWVAKETISKYKIRLRLKFTDSAGSQDYETAIKDVAATTVKVPDDVKPLL